MFLVLSHLWVFQNHHKCAGNFASHVSVTTESHLFRLVLYWRLLLYLYKFWSWGSEVEVLMLICFPGAELSLSLLFFVLRVTASFAAIRGLVSSALFSCLISLSVFPSVPLTATWRAEPFVSFTRQSESPLFPWGRQEAVGNQLTAPQF